MFCRNCAEVLLESDITCPKCGFAAGTGMKYCASCGSETPVGMVICEICGMPVGNVIPDPSMQFQQAPQPNVQQQFAQQQPFAQQQAHAQQPNVQFQQVNPNFQQQYGQQQGTQQFRSADPNMMNMGQQAYSDPNVYAQNGSAQYYQGVTYKSKVTAGLLGIFLGGFGVHNFYLGYTSKAVVQLLLSVLSCGALYAISEIWGLIEGVMILCGSIKQDGKGLPLKD